MGFSGTEVTVEQRGPALGSQDLMQVLEAGDLNGLSP